jgi:hypothetical protein
MTRLSEPLGGSDIFPRRSEEVPIDRTRIGADEPPSKKSR